MQEKRQSLRAVFEIFQSLDRNLSANGRVECDSYATLGVELLKGSQA